MRAQLTDQQTRYVVPMLGQCWASVVDVALALAQHRDNVTCLLPRAFYPKLIWPAEIFYWNHKDQICFFSVWNHNKCLSYSSFRFSWIPMLWVYGHYMFYSFSSGIDLGGHNLTSIDVRFWRLKSVPALEELLLCKRRRPTSCRRFVLAGGAPKKKDKINQPPLMSTRLRKYI